MSIDDQISAFAAKLDGWFVDFAAKLLQGDETAEIKTWVAGLKLLKQSDDLKREGLAALATLLNSADVTSESERINVLLRGFELAAKLEAVCDGVSDADGMKQTNRIMDDIVVALAAFGLGRTLLVPLLEHDNAHIRVLAGRYLIDLMPDRVVPILEKIDKEGDGSPDSFRAYLVLRLWEVERLGRFRSIEGRVVRG
jgi:hypothetical protein